VKFKVAKRKHPVGKRKGQTVYYAIQDEHPHTTWAEVEERISQATTISRADLRAVTIALHDIITQEIRAGRSVDLADLGSFKAWTWQIFARITGANLKSPYDPLHNQEDAVIERIIQLSEHHLL